LGDFAVSWENIDRPSARSATGRTKHQEFSHFSGKMRFVGRLPFSDAFFHEIGGSSTAHGMPVKLRRRVIEIPRDLLKIGAIRIFRSRRASESGGDGPYQATHRAEARQPSPIA